MSYVSYALICYFLSRKTGDRISLSLYFTETQLPETFGFVPLFQIEDTNTYKKTTLKKSCFQPQALEICCHLTAAWAKLRLHCKKGAEEMRWWVISGRGFLISYGNQASVYSVMLAYVAFVFNYLNSRCKKKKNKPSSYWSRGSIQNTNQAMNTDCAG